MDGLIGFIDRMGRYGVLIGCVTIHDTAGKISSGFPLSHTIQYHHLITALVLMRAFTRTLFFLTTLVVLLLL